MRIVLTAGWVEPGDDLDDGYHPWVMAYHMVTMNIKLPKPIILLTMVMSISMRIMKMMHQILE